VHRTHCNGRKGGYNRNSRVQAAALSPAVLMLEGAAKMVTLPPDSQPIVIADYGSSQGRNSLVPLQTAIRALRERVGQTREISVIHTDLPENDFTVLFETLLTSPESYLRKDGAVFASAVGRSYYEQFLPTHSVALGWSSWAVQWLSRTPARIPDQVQVAFSHDAPTRAAFAQQAAEDWQSFLRMRGRELCAGGRLVVLAMAVDDNGDFGYRPVLDAMYSALVEMVDGGFLSAEELQRMAIPTVGRSRTDFLAPFGPADVSTDFAWKNSKFSLARTTSGRILNSTGTHWRSALSGRHLRALRFFRLSPAAWMAAGPPHVQVIL